jgi:DeoR/GlpR family transcriptional regulator of sugar metabolism
MNRERQDLILKYLEKTQQAGIGEISQNFGVSIATARRDLDELSQLGKLQRVHGGALFIQKAPPELPIFQRQAEQAQEKAQIGAAAARLILDGETIFLASGTTTLEITRHLDQFQHLTVYTNSLMIINRLANNPHINLVAIGGQYRISEYVFYGYLVERALSELSIDKVFIGFRAISIEQGFTNDFLPELTTDRAILKSGKEIIVLADHTKFNRISTTLVAPLTTAHRIITDNLAPEEFISKLREKGIDVIVAPANILKENLER